MNFLMIPTVKNGREEEQEEQIYTIDDFPYAAALEAPISTKDHITYLNIPAAFDIETTTIDGDPPQGFLYHWQVCVIDKVCFGRTWEEYKLFSERLYEGLKLSENRRLVLWVHNLSFEFQFLWSHFVFTDIFARDARKVIRARCGAIEYRCSYFLSNMSLRKFCENSRDCIHWKLKDTYDYRKLRTPATPLTEEEQGYCYNDVRGLCECIAYRLREDTIITMPYTSTGYVRREMRRIVLKNKKNRYQMLNMALDGKLYKLMREAFRGGNTHANAIFSNQIMTNIDSYDLVSSYPSAMMTELFPMSAFLPCNTKRILKYMRSGEDACIGRFRFTNIRQRETFGIPYIAIAHCRHAAGIRADNGRVLSADSLEITLTDIDFRIIDKTYIWDKIEGADTYCAEYGYLPMEMRQGIMMYFKDKCELKGQPGKEYEYMKSKNRLNGIFGMSVMDLLQDTVTFQDGIWSKAEETQTVDQRLAEYYHKHSSFLSYQWGVWVTARARERLQYMLDKVGRDVCYIDTDSIKCLPGHRAEFDQVNRDLLRKAETAPIPPICKVGSNTYVMGLWEYEGSYMLKTLGAKKYATVKDHKITTTVAGLGKSYGAEALEDYAIKEFAAGRCDTDTIYRAALEGFKIGAVFDPAGRTTAYYNDEKEKKITVNGETFTSGSNIAIVDTTYTLGVTDEYWELIQDAAQLAEII